MLWLQSEQNLRRGLHYLGCGIGFCCKVNICQTTCQAIGKFDVDNEAEDDASEEIDDDGKTVVCKTIRAGREEFVEEGVEWGWVNPAIENFIELFHINEDLMMAGEATYQRCENEY